MTSYDVVIIGGGPAGMTAGLYASRTGLKTIILERSMFGGQIVNAQIVENYPGFPDGISGFELASLIQQQAAKYGVEIISGDVTGITPGTVHQVITEENNYSTRVVIICTGSEYSKLGIPGEEKFIGRGVSYCATCDGFLFKEKDVAIVGGGDTAISDALELATHASKVYVIHRRSELRASQILQQRAFEKSNISFVWDSVVEEVSGDTMVTELKLRNVKDDTGSTLVVAGIFVAVGLKPNSHSFTDILDVDNLGYIITDQTMATSVPGIYAAGDIRQNSIRQVVTATGDGATAAMTAFKYIQEQI
jgi:thioredoxin reductase (NADPH)